MMPCQRVEGPVGIRHDSDVAIRADEDRHFGARLALSGSAFGGIQDFTGLFHEVHTLISQSPPAILVRTCGAGRKLVAARCYTLAVAAPGKVFTPATQAS